jgi:hypothetical protein
VKDLLGKSPCVVACISENVTCRHRPESTLSAPAKQSVTTRQSTSYEGSSTSVRLSATNSQSTSPEGSSLPAKQSVTTRQSTSYEGSSTPVRLSATNSQSTSPEGSSLPVQLAVQPSQSTASKARSKSDKVVGMGKGPSYLVSAVKRLVDLAPCSVHRPSILFEATASAAAWNWALLKAKDNDVGRLLAEQPFSVVTPGSEFRRVEDLESLLGSHPLWSRLATSLSNGAQYPLEPYSDKEMALDLRAQVDRGNHKSALSMLTVLDRLNEVDVSHGYAFCLPVEALYDIKGAAVAPHGVVRQGTINELGQLITKDRPTHDQTFSAREEGKSINDRCNMDLLTPCVFGHALLRLIHFILHLRRRFPGVRIFIQKVDFKSAYRRLHLSYDMATKCITVVRDLAFLSLRMPFGGRPCPSLWSDVSETITDLSNSLAVDPSWDPETLRSPLQHLIPPTVSEPQDVPFADSLPVAFDIPDGEGKYKADVFIDDVISVVLDDGRGCARGAAASLLAIHAVCRPVADDEPVLRNELTAEKKLIAESLLEEVKTTLGWLLDTRRLLISLTMDKYSSWAAAVWMMLLTEVCRYEAMETLVGRLNHVCFIIPQARHFMSRLRWLLLKSRRGRALQLRPQVLADLRLWLRFLQMAHKGISLNLVSFRVPTHVFRSDAAEHGMGGFCGLSGKAWRLELPRDCRVGCREGISLNLLEFLGGIVSIWVEILAGRVPPGSCLQAQGDSTSSAGWLRKSNFSEHNHPLQLEASRHLAFILLEASAILYSQWFPGKANGLSDVLSRDSHLTDDDLTSLCRSSIPFQVPQNFAICRLPHIIFSWVISLLRSQPLIKESSKEPTRSSTWLGRDGASGSQPSSSSMTSTSRLSSPGLELVSSAPSLPPSDPLVFQAQLIASLPQERSPIPSIMWRRPLWIPASPTLASTEMGPLRDFYSASTSATEI